MARSTSTPARQNGARKRRSGTSITRWCSASTRARPAASTTIRAPRVTSGRSGARAKRRTKASTAARSEELDDLGGERVRLFERGEVAALLHHRPALDVGIGLRPERARRAQDFLRKLGVADGNIDRIERPRPVQARVIRPERGADPAGEPVERDVGEQVIAVDAAGAPGAGLLRGPTRRGRG